jgi:hypothetical protein
MNLHRGGKLAALARLTEQIREWEGAWLALLPLVA